MKFKDMPYERVDLDSLGKEYDALTEKVRAAKDGETLIALFREREKLSIHLNTMASLAYTRNSIDTNDKFYEAEQEFYDSSLPAFQEHDQNLTLAFYESPFRPELEKVVGSLVFKNIGIELKTFSPEIVEELGRENQLVTEYQKLIASAKIEFDGKKLNISQLAAYKQNPDRNVRHAAYKAESDFYMANADKLDSIYDELVRVRTKAAQKLGLKNFTELGYLRQMRNCYNPEMVAAFRAQVVADIVPIVNVLKEKQSARIGVKGDLHIWDDVFRYAEGNPKPLGTPDDIMAAGKRMYEDMSPETAEFINFMYDNELLDLVAKEGKAVGGYCTSFPEYKSPFIFSNFNGTAADVGVLTHEAGHAFENYIASRRMPLPETSFSTSEINEIHSMSMEHFTYPWMDRFFGEKTNMYLYDHLWGALNVIPYMCCVDEFQHRVYDERLNAAERRAVWRELEREYMPWRDYDESEFLSGGGFWMQKQHIFLYPFYYIEYALAQMCAFQFYLRMEENRAAAWADYLNLCRAGGSRGYFDLLKLAKLDNPFNAETVEAITNAVVRKIDEMEKKL